MASSTAAYIPQHNASAYRRQALLVWAVTLSVVGMWVLAIVAAPVLLKDGYGGVSGAIYGFFSHICHQLPERSFWLDGHQFAVCSRCFGVYFGLLAGLAAYPLWRSILNTEPLPRIWLFLSLIPIGIDWSLGVFGIWENTHLSRFTTGLILGVACATFIIPALVEIAQNLTAKRRFATD